MLIATSYGCSVHPYEHHCASGSGQRVRGQRAEHCARLRRRACASQWRVAHVGHAAGPVHHPAQPRPDCGREPVVPAGHVLGHGRQWRVCHVGSAARQPHARAAPVVDCVERQFGSRGAVAVGVARAAGGHRHWQHAGVTR